MNTAIANKKTLVNDFVKKYTALNSEQAKLGMVKSIMKRTCCPIIEKKFIIEMMVDKSKGEGKVAYIDMVLAKINFYMAIIGMYTNLETEKDEKGVAKNMEAYDMLTKADIFNAVLNEIGDKELGELMTVNEAALNTWHTKNTSTAAYVSDLVEKVSIIFSAAMGKELGSLADMLGDSEEDKAELLAVLKENFKLK